MLLYWLSPVPVLICLHAIFTRICVPIVDSISNTNPPKYVENELKLSFSKCYYVFDCFQCHLFSYDRALVFGTILISSACQVAQTFYTTKITRLSVLIKLKHFTYLFPFCFHSCFQVFNRKMFKKKCSNAAHCIQPKRIRTSPAYEVKTEMMPFESMKK